MPKKPTAADAQLILQLYDLRREPEMRKARNWWFTEFWPTSADDFMKIAATWARRKIIGCARSAATGAWPHPSCCTGADADLFLQPAVSGEMFIVFAKVHPFLKELREKMGEPADVRNIEKVIMSSKYGRERFKFMLKRVETMRERWP
jgi:hypothetical protein